MILNKLSMKNFRQFKGEQQLEFASSSHSSKKNVTVVFGENGKGKTGIFRAIIFCLFGERRLPQDGDVPNSELQLVNASALEHSEGQPVETYVELTFSHKNKNYILKRTIHGMMSLDQTYEELAEIKLVEVTPEGNTRIIEPADIEKVVNSILDSRVKDYFLFDGEKIERLTRAGVEQRREIGKGIRNLLNVDALEKAKKATEKLTRDLEDELRKKASPELAKLLKRLGDNEQALKDNNQRLEEIGDEVSLARHEISKVDKELAAFNEIRELINRRKDLEDKLQGLEQQLKDHLIIMKGLSSKAASLLIAPIVINVFNYIEQQKQKGEIPSEIRKDLIERILSEKKCICGSDICEGTESYNRILEWKNKTSDVTVQDSALNLWRYLSVVQGHFSDESSEVENRLIAYANIRNEIELTRQKLEAVRDQIGTSERKDATKLDDHRKELEDKLVKLEAESLNIKDAIADLEREHTQLEAQLKDEKLKATKHDEYSKRATLARETRDALSSVYRDFTKEIKVLIGNKASDLFCKLLDSEGRNNLKRVIVNDDYSIQVMDRWNKPFLANISAGQRQIMSISFIAALAQAASGDSILEMPLFMDTPFGRLSYEHRQNLIKLVPDFSSQWILLATDTEFRKQEAKLLKEGKNWGKFYMLRGSDEGNTTIEEHMINTVPALLKDEESTI